MSLDDRRGQCLEQRHAHMVGPLCRRSVFDRRSARLDMCYAPRGCAICHWRCVGLWACVVGPWPLLEHLKPDTRSHLGVASCIGLVLPHRALGRAARCTDDSCCARFNCRASNSRTRSSWRVHCTTHQHICNVGAGMYRGARLPLMSRSSNMLLERTRGR
jgi:hypothetical protein